MRLHFTIILTFGLIDQVDRILIYLLLPKWDHDTPSSYHANLLRKGKEIRRRTMFNR
jgi:CDP-diacylglycerol--glycerol-3-phosphate 3-phosphatidyltransferase